MPIYEFACGKCRKVFSFLSKRVQPKRTPACPKCGNRRLSKEISAFAMISGAAEPAAADPGGPDSDAGMPDLSDPRVARAMSAMERDMEHLDENNPRHMAQMLKRMKEIMPGQALPKEFDVAIKRLEAGEDPDKIEADMGDVLGGMMGDESEGQGGGAGGDAFSHDPGLYEY
ncbi:MAG: zinc ribbon domain-containing protein [Verrucomicrobiales bacterium]|nr:zinc ribbon domain-containing protein [Verrucomicrobiales bacterium]